MSIFYVYELWDPRNDTIFYVGKGTGNRARKHEKMAREAINPKNHKLRRIKRILSENLSPIIKYVLETEQENLAFLKEIELIAFYGRKDLNLGPLLNHTNGGDGGNTVKGQSEEKIKERYQKRANTIESKTQEEKDETSKKRTESLKLAWKENYEEKVEAIGEGNRNNRDKVAHANAVSNGWKNRSEDEKKETKVVKSKSKKNQIRNDSGYVENYKKFLKASKLAVSKPIEVTLPTGDILVANSLEDWSRKYGESLNVKHNTITSTLSGIAKGFHPKCKSSRWIGWKVRFL